MTWMRPYKSRMALVFTFVGLVLALVVTRLFQLSFVDGERFVQLARQQHERVEEARPLRGAIRDRSGEPLAISVAVPSIFVRPGRLPDDDSGRQLALSLGLSGEQWHRKISTGSPFVWLRRHATSRELEALEGFPVSGVGTVPERKRLYPNGSLAATVVGVAGVDSQGLEGVELSYDAYLSGAPRTFGVERDALGRSIFGASDAGELPEGASLTLTLDMGIQYAAERELERQVEATRAKGGVVLVLDPQSGEILALAQRPSFDPNRIERTRPEMLRNRVIADAFEPGSTLKALLAAAALEEGIVTRDDLVFCENGRYRFGGRTIHDHNPFDWLTFAEVIQKSSNIGTSKVSALLGAERYHRYLEAFGLGAKTGVDLVGEQRGILRPTSRWRTIDIATASFGQGVAVTPLQLATAFATIANGGYRLRPYVVNEVTSPDGEVVLRNRPEIVRRVVREEVARELTNILTGVVDEGGTGFRARIPGLAVAGKTGTSQKVDPVHGGYSKKRTSSFIGFLPAEDPRVLILVVIDEPQTAVYGGVVAAPVFRAIAQEAVEQLHIRPRVDWEGGFSDVELRTVSRERNDPEDSSFLGLSLREALRRARERGVAAEIQGTGYVVHQDPPPGELQVPGGTVRLELERPGEKIS